MIAQIACALATGNRAALDGAPAAACSPPRCRGALQGERVPVAAADRIDAVLTDREGAALVDLLAPIAAPRRADRARLPRIRPKRFAAATPAPLDFLVNERSICINTTAAGGNASLDDDRVGEGGPSLPPLRGKVAGGAGRMRGLPKHSRNQRVTRRKNRKGNAGAPP